MTDKTKYISVRLNMNKSSDATVYNILRSLQDESIQHFVKRAILFYDKNYKIIKKLDALEALDVDPQIFTSVLTAAISGEPYQQNSGKKQEQKKSVKPEKNPELKPGQKQGQKRQEKNTSNQKKEKTQVETKESNEADVIFADDDSIDFDKADDLLNGFMLP